MQQHKIYIDEWSLLEKLCLASGVKRFGENWTSVCDFIKPKLQVEERQWNWFTPETCEAQYKQLHNECVKLQINCEDPVMQILQNLKSQCKIESQLVEDQRNKYITLRNIIESIAKKENVDGDDEFLENYYKKAQQDRKEKEENNRKYEESLKNRDLKKTEFEKTNISKSPSKQETKSDSSSPLTTSPLLSSLLNNPPAIQYRPTLSTTSFVPTKVSQGTSRSIITEKIQSISDVIKDTFGSEISDQSNVLEKSSNMYNNSSTIVARKLDFQDIRSSTAVNQHQHLQVQDNSTVKELTTSMTDEIPHSNESQNLENLMLISPNEEVYLSEVDIPPETLLEVIDDLKEGAISLDKIIRDLEGAEEENIIINKEDLSSVTMNEAFISTKVTKTTEQNENTGISQEEEDSAKLKEPSLDVICEKSTKTDNKIVDESPKIEINNVVPLSPENISNCDENNEISSLKQTIIENKNSLETKDEKIEESTKNVGINETNEVNDNKLRLKPVINTPNIEDKLFENTTTVNLNESEEVNLSEHKVQEESDVIETTDAKEETNKIDSSNDETRLSVDSYVTYGSTSDYEEQENSIKDKKEECVETSVSRDDIKDMKASLEVICETNNIEKQENTITDLLDEHLKTIETPENVSLSEITETKDVENVNDENEILIENRQINKTDKLKIEEIKETVELKQNAQESVSEKQENIEVENRHEINELLIEKTSNVDNTKECNEQKSPVNSSNVDELDNKKIDDSFIETEEKVNETLNVEIEEPVLNTTEKENIETEIQDEIKNLAATKPSVKRYGRKRKSNSETTDNNAKVMKMSSEVQEQTESQEFHINNTKELNITIKDIRDGGVESISKEESLKVKEEINEKELSLNLPLVKATQDKETKHSGIKLKLNIPRRSSGRTCSPVLKSTSSLNSSSKVVDESELIKTRKKSIMFAYTRLMSHKYSNAFQKPITNKQVPGYENVIYNPIDLYTIKKKIDNKQITSVAEFQRDVLLMLNNAKMFNRINSQVYNMAVEVQEETLPHIQLTVQTLGEGIRTVEKSNEKIRKRQSLDNPKKDLKLIKRIKCSVKEDVMLKKIKTEEVEDTDHS